jgi:hypothetical protein
MILYYRWVRRRIRRYDFICSLGCYYIETGARHTCSDCASKRRYEDNE